MLRTALVTLAIVSFACSAPPAPDRVDDSGPHRVVVIAPAAAEMLEALELLDRVVAVGNYGPWPAGLESLPSAGGYDVANAERVLELRADLLINTASQAAEAGHEQLRGLGVEVLSLDTSTYEGVFDSLAEIGQAFGQVARSGEIAARMRRQLDEVSARAEKLERRRVLFVVGRDPLYVAGPGSHIDRMIELVGGVNVAHDAMSAYQQLSVEAVLERQPEVIIDTSDNRPGAARGRRAGSWGRWDFLPAVTDDRVHWVDPSQLVIPGIRLPEMTALMGRLIHPEEFGEPSSEDHAPRPSQK